MHSLVVCVNFIVTLADGKFVVRFITLDGCRALVTLNLRQI